MNIKTVLYEHNYRNTTRGQYKETFHAHPGIEFCYVHEGTGNLWLEITEKVGLMNSSYFCQAFKKNLGVSPHQFRLINQGKQTRSSPKKQQELDRRESGDF